MKSSNIVLIMFFVVILFTSKVVTAQELAIKEGTYVINEISYIVGTPNKYGTCAISRKDLPNLKSNRKVVDKIPLDYVRVSLINRNVWINRVRTLLGRDKCEALCRAGERIRLMYTFTPDGKILNIAFGVKVNTILTLSDIALIDIDLRKNYNAAFSSDFNAHEHFYWITLNEELDFTNNSDI